MLLDLYINCSGSFRHLLFALTQLRVRICSCMVRAVSGTVRTQIRQRFPEAAFIELEPDSSKAHKLAVHDLYNSKHVQM